MSTTPFNGLPENDPVYVALSPEEQQMTAPALTDAGFWVLLWAAIRSLLLAVTGLVSRSERTSTATEQLATAVQTYTTRPTPTKPLKLDSPESFNGRPDKVEAFINALTLYFDGQAIKDDKSRVIFALSLGKGGNGDIAGNWADLQRKQIVDHQNSPTPLVHIGTWFQFVHEFKAYFQYTSSKDEAQRKLAKLHQGKGTADEYITLFKGLAPATNFDQEALLHYFRLGLNPALCTAVFNIRPQPTTYEQWLVEASQVDRTYRHSKEYSSASGRNEQTPQQKARLPAVQMPTKVERDPDAMDVDRHKDTRICFRCNKPGHISRWCPENKQRFNVRGMSKEDRAELLKSIQDFPESQE
jgi:hypothetical protein